MATDMKYKCPMCGDPIRSHRMIDGDEQPPYTYNHCCSPECGQQADGYFQALGRYCTKEEIDDDAVGQQYRWNKWELERLFILEDERRRDCDHEFVKMMGHAEETTYLDDSTMKCTTYALLGCRKCGANKTGDVLGTKTRSRT